MGDDQQKKRDEQTPSGYPQHSPGGARPRAPDMTRGNEPPPADAKDVHHGPPASGEEDLPGEGNGNTEQPGPDAEPGHQKQDIHQESADQGQRNTDGSIGT